MKSNLSVLNHKIKIFPCREKDKPRDENYITAFAGFMPINNNVRQMNSVSFGNVLINPYFIFRIRYGDVIKSNMEIEFWDAKDNRVFRIIDCSNFEEANIFLDMISVNLTKINKNV